MAYIAPDSDIRLMENVPIPYSREHTLWWSSLGNQTRYFLGISTSINFQNYSYVRHQRALKVFRTADDLFEVNYMMFRNTAYGDKWFYAFVTDIQYVNDSTSLIFFEIDAIQTFFFEMELQTCWIERQHSTTDDAGDNIVPEKVDTGYLVCNEVDVFPSSMESLQILIAVNASIVDGAAEPVSGGIYAGSFSGLEYNFFPLSTTGAQNAVNFLDNYANAGAADSVVGISIVPSICEPESWATPNPPREIQLIQPYSPNNRTSPTLDGYTPRNNKLFTYPYNYLEVTNSLGAFFNFPWEFFGDLTEGNIVFYVVASTSLSPEIICYPHTSFRGIPNNQSYQLAISGFPQCAWSSDPYLAYLAQTGARQTIGFAMAAGDILSGVASIAAPMLTGGASSAIQPIGRLSGAQAQLAAGEFSGLVSGAMEGIASGIGAISNQIATNYDMSRVPPTTHGAESSSAMTVDGRMVFVYRCMSVNANVARTIDDYFTMYGYAQHIVAKPNIHARSQWTYIKTVGAKVGGSMPGVYEREIERALDRGITFWVSPENVGNYSLDNNMLS